MKPRDIELKLNIKNYKAGKFLHLMAIDAIEDFERNHPKTIPLLLASLKHGDPVNSLKMASKLERLAESLLSSIASLKENIEDYMSNEIEEMEDGQGSQYITTSGNMGFAWKQGEESIEVNLGNDTDDAEEIEEEEAEEAPKKKSKKKSKK
jgi:hypothetical protein